MICHQIYGVMYDDTTFSRELKCSTEVFVSQLCGNLKGRCPEDPSEIAAQKIKMQLNVEIRFYKK